MAPQKSRVVRLGARDDTGTRRGHQGVGAAGNRRRMARGFAESEIGRLLGRPGEEQDRAGLRAHPARDRAAARDLARNRRVGFRAIDRGSRRRPRRGGCRLPRGLGDPHRLGQLGLRGGVRGRSPPAWPFGVPVQALPAGLLLTHPGVVACRPPGRTSSSRSRAPETAPRAGPCSTRCSKATTAAATSSSPATATASSPPARPATRGWRRVVLDEKTEDQSLVMTSSFTNMVVAGGVPGRHPAGRSLRASRVEALAARPAERLAAGRRRTRWPRGAQRLPLRGLPGQRLPHGIRPRSGPQDARDDRGPRLHADRVVPGPAPRSHVGGARGHPGRRLPVVGRDGPRLRDRSRWPSWTARSSGPAS